MKLYTKLYNYIYYIISINNIVYISFLYCNEYKYIYGIIYVYIYIGYVRVSSGVKDVEYFWI